MKESKNKKKVIMSIEEYQKLVSIAEEKKDIKIEFIVQRQVLTPHLELAYWMNSMMHKVKVECGSNVDTEFIKGVKTSMNEFCKAYKEETGHVVDKIAKELDSIKSKWWYKLFN